MIRRTGDNMIELDDEVKAHMYQWLRDYINHKCFYRVKPGEPLLDGKLPNSKYVWQIYMRRGLFNPTFMNYVGILFWEKFADRYRQQPFQVTGLETGSTPILTAIAMTAHLYEINVNVFSTRAERKKYGLLNRFEGIVNYNLPVVIVDDLCNSKSTIFRCKKYCEMEDLEIYDPGFVILNKEENPYVNHDKYIGEGYQIDYLFTLNDFDKRWDHYLEKNGNSKLLEFVREKHSKD